MDERQGYPVFLPKNFWITVSENLIGNFCGFRNFLVWEELYGQAVGWRKFPSFLFLSHIIEKVPWDLSVNWKIFWQRRFFGCEGDITFLQRNFFVSHYQELSMGTLHFWRKNSCIENFLWLCLWYHLFLRTLVCLTLPKKIEWEQFGVAEKLRWRKKTLDERGGYHVFPSKCFCPTLPETFFGNSLVFHNISGSEKFVWMRERDITLFRQKKFWITVPEKFNWKFRGFRNFLV